MGYSCARRLLAAALLSAALAGCAPQAAPSGEATAPTALPIATNLPTTQAPTIAPTIASTAVPTQEKLPGFESSLWAVLARNDFNGDGIEESVLYIPSDVQAQSGFNDDYLNQNAVTTGVIAVVQSGAEAPTILLQIDLTGASADKPLLNFPQDDPPSAFLLALDPGSSYFMSVLPLRADGSQHSGFFAINPGATPSEPYRLAAQPQPPDPQAVPRDDLTTEEIQAVQAAAFNHLYDQAIGRPGRLGVYYRRHRLPARGL